MINKIDFRLVKNDRFVIVEFILSENIGPDDLKALVPPNPIKENFAQKGVILSGKGPIWLYGFLIHYYHATQWVATYDPRLGGAVVVESHVTDISAGDIISLD